MRQWREEPTKLCESSRYEQMAIFPALVGESCTVHLHQSYADIGHGAKYAPAVCVRVAPVSLDAVGLMRSSPKCDSGCRISDRASGECDGAPIGVCGGYLVEAEVGYFGVSGVCEYGMYL